MKKYLFLLSTIVLNCAMLSCSSSEEESVDLGEAKQVVNMMSEAQPVQLTEAQRVFANDNNKFTLNFLKTVNDIDKTGKSFIYSPLSITYVLGMVNDAAAGETEKELEQALGFHEGGIKAVNDYCKKLIEGLPKVDDKVTLNIANALFVNKDLATLKTQYQSDIQHYYGAKAENLDFKSPSALSTINGWANDHSNGMIPKILDDISPNVVTYLLNAIYFKADWASKFEKKNTKEEIFTTESGSAKLPLMHQNVLINYLKNDTYTAVEMPYGNGCWKMTVMLPEEGKTTSDIMSRISRQGCLEGHHYGEAMDSWYRPYEVDLKLPRYETSSDTDDLGGNGLVGLLNRMGIQQAFDPIFANIPNMCEEGSVYISRMRQKAKIKVNEEGSEAAAVTIADMKFTTSVGPVEYPKAVFHANRPFVYCISEASSGVILFVGKFTGE